MADTSGLLAFFNRREPAHAATRAVVEAQGDRLVVSPFVVAELDYLVGSRLGVDAEVAVLRELSGGAYHLVEFSASDLRQAVEVVERYRDQAIGITDASLVVLAERYRTRSILTLDRRHFDVLRPLNGHRFEILPAHPAAGRG